MEAVTGWSALSDQFGFIVAYPEGVGRTWNDGRPGGAASREGADDVGFLAALVGEFRRTHGVDPGRVYAAGISRGAFFCHYLAVRRADLVAAIGPVAGGMTSSLAEAFRPSRPVSVLAIQGTEDPLVPFHGGPMAGDRGGVLPAEEAVRRWAEYNGCRATPLREERSAGAMRVWQVKYGGGREGTEAALVAVEGGGHVWPGGLPFLPERMVGKSCPDLEASALLWDFFSRHPRSPTGKSGTDPGTGFEALERIYADLQAELEILRPICRLTGRCCRFREYGHQLWTTPIEIDYLIAGAGLPRAVPEGTCPYLDPRGECGARPWRMLACRIFFCDPRYRYHMGPLHERYHRRIRDLHRAVGVPYAYFEFLGALARRSGPESEKKSPGSSGPRDPLD